MSRLPSQLTYNDLNGLEATEILVHWFRQLLSQQPLLQPHLTLPMAKITLDIGVQIDMYIGGTVPVASPPDRVDIAGSVSLSNDLSTVGGSNVRMSGPGGMTARLAHDASNMPRREAPAESCCEHTENKLSTVINAAPLPGGSPPDQVREQHGLGVPRPGYGPRDTGSHLFLADVIDTTSSKRDGIVADGYTFAPDAPLMPAAQVLEQTIPVDDGSIQIDLSGAGIRHESGITVKAPDHRASVKSFGDEKGHKYSSVNGVYDAGPAGLMGKSMRGGGGLGGDGRSRISFGNNHRG